MSAFTPAEIEYLQGQQLGPLATVNESGEPHVVPVGFRHNAELDTIDIGGHNLGKSKKFRDAARIGRAAFVVDDVLPPWQARGVEVRERAEVFKEGGEGVNADSGRADPSSPEPDRRWGIDHPTPSAQTAGPSAKERSRRSQAMDTGGTVDPRVATTTAEIWSSERASSRCGPADWAQYSKGSRPVGPRPRRYPGPSIQAAFTRHGTLISTLVPVTERVRFFPTSPTAPTAPAMLAKIRRQPRRALRRPRGDGPRRGGLLGRRRRHGRPRRARAKR